MTPHLNRLIETVQMRGHNICFHAELTKIIPNYLGVIDDNFSYFFSKSYIVTPHLNHLVEMVQLRGHNIWFYAELTTNILNFHQILSYLDLSSVTAETFGNMHNHADSLCRKPCFMAGTLGRKQESPGDSPGRSKIRRKQTLVD